MVAQNRDSAITYQAPTKKHDRDRNMLQVLRSPRIAPSRHMFHPYVREAVKKDEERLDHLS